MSGKPTHERLLGGRPLSTYYIEGGGHCLLGWWEASEPREQLHKLLLQQAHGVTFGGSRVGAGAAWVNKLKVPGTAAMP